MPWSAVPDFARKGRATDPKRKALSKPCSVTPASLRRVFTFWLAIEAVTLCAQPFPQRDFPEATYDPRDLQLLADLSERTIPYAMLTAIMPHGSERFARLQPRDVIGLSEDEVCRSLSLPRRISGRRRQICFSGGVHGRSEKLHVLTFSHGKVVQHEIRYVDGPGCWFR
jgi:hypothetical protein